MGSRLLRPLGKGKVRLHTAPTGDGRVLVTLPMPDTILAWRDAAQFIKFIRSSILAAQKEIVGLRPPTLSPTLTAEVYGKGLVKLGMPQRSKKLQPNDAARWILEIAHAIRATKIDESEDRPAWDPERDHHIRMGW